MSAESPLEEVRLPFSEPAGVNYIADETEPGLVGFDETTDEAHTAKRAHDLAREAEASLDWPAAVRWWQHFLTFRNDEWWSYTALAVALREVGRIEEAYAALRTAQDLIPHNPNALTDYHARCEWADAMRGLTNGSGPNRAMACKAIQRVICARFFDVAGQWCEKAVGLFPDDPHLAYLRAHMAARSGDLRAASGRAVLALARFPDHPGLQRLAKLGDEPIERKADLIYLALQRRRKITFVGNCQAETLSELYKKYIAPARNDLAVFVKREQFDEPISTVHLESADIIVGVQADFLNSLNGLDLPPNTQVFLVPVVAAPFLWPFAGKQSTLKNVNWERRGVDFSDWYLERLLRSKGGSPDDVIREYLSLDVNKIINLDRLLEISLEKQSERDERLGFSVAKSIKENFRLRKLFRSFGHSETELQMEVARTLFVQMGTSHSQVSEMERASTSDNLPMQQHNAPIHPSIIRHFSFDWVADNSRYFLWDRYVTFEENVRFYVKGVWSNLVERGLRYAGEGLMEEATATLEDALLLHPHSAKVRMALAEIAVKKRDLEAALTYIEQALSCPYPDASYWHAKAQVLSAIDRTDEAIEAAGCAIGSDPASPVYPAFRADLLERTGAYDQSYQDRLRAVHSAPHVASSGFALAATLSRSDSPAAHSTLSEAEMISYHEQVRATDHF
jgi:tetratricopeptide (TPR) repeat protein